LTTLKRHHYLSEFYLRGFSQENRIWVFDRETGKTRHDSPHNTAVISQYYSIKEQDGSHNTEVESILSIIESLAVNVIQKLNNHKEITESEKQKLALFIGLQRVRVPQFEQILKDMFDAQAKSLLEVGFATPERVKSLIEQYKEKIGDTSDINPEELAEFVNRGEYKVIPHRHFTIASMLNCGLEIATYLWQMDWFILHTQNDNVLITTDTPFTVFAPKYMTPPYRYGISLIEPGAVKLIPLSKSCSLAMVDRGDKLFHRELTNEQVRIHNEILTSHCHRLVIGTEEGIILDLIKLTKIDESKPEPIVKIEKYGDMNGLLTVTKLEVAKYSSAWLGSLIQ
jgi:hypothetical protein